MCGLFGFSGPGRGDPDLLAHCGGLAARRGPDAWGLWADGRKSAGLGRLTAAAVASAPSPRVMLGHCRLATVLGTKRVECCQPITVGQYVVTHNGTVGNVDALRRRHGFDLATGVDSEAIGHLMGIHRGDLAAAMGEVGGHFAVVVLCTVTGRVQMLAHGLPLWVLKRAEGMYWCSVRPGAGWGAVHA